MLARRVISFSDHLLIQRDDRESTDSEEETDQEASLSNEAPEAPTDMGNS